MLTPNLITLDDYWMGRDESHALLLSIQLRANAQRTVALANALMGRARVYGKVTLDTPNPVHGGLLSSGWRPPNINANTAGAAVNSLHMTCEAVDIYDPDGELDEWLMTDEGQRALVGTGLWIEHPAATRRWSHVQTRPPKSGRRVFYP